MKFKKPNQHGAWAMIIMPVLFGMFASTFNVYQLLFFAAWFMIFFFIDNLLFFVKQRKKQIGYVKGSLLFLAIAILLLMPIILYDYRVLFFFLAMLPFGAINLYFASQRNERHLLNDFSAITIFSIAGLLVYFIGEGQLHQKMIYIFLISFLYFVGTTFYVKTMIREKKNITYKYISFIYHIAGLILAFVIHPLIGIAFLPSLFRAIYFYGKQLKPIKIGIAEIANAVFITIFVGIFITQHLN
ncbi:YwiC-like family protein [Macrococcoides caseolyticum]|uniref:YwiC-like family protein n=1 Tax=Macrococcoides caseolyticum TaxID=69966 RepID=UPI001F40FB36|nr:YwiC-like family protein [Macrococcus caseolyticus]MCE4955891.1 YwiC-like family protein [Macrococcus caseolyticus]